MFYFKFIMLGPMPRNQRDTHTHYIGPAPRKQMHRLHWTCSQKTDAHVTYNTEQIHLSVPISSINHRKLQGTCYLQTRLMTRGYQHGSVVQFHLIISSPQSHFHRCQSLWLLRMLTYM